jgi:FMN reductase
MARIAIVSGSPTAGSRLHGLTTYAETRLRSSGWDVDTIYVADLPAADLLHAHFNSPEITAALDVIRQADAVVLASPVYKASYSGVLKTFLDLIPQKGLEGKIVLPLFIGGTIAHLLAIDYALKPVVAALGGTNILGGVYAVDKWVVRGEDGAFDLADELTERLNDSLDRLNGELLRLPAVPAAGLS